MAVIQFSDTDTNAAIELTNDRRTASRSSGTGWVSVRTDAPPRNSGKWFFSFRARGTDGTAVGAGIAEAADSAVLDTWCGNTPTSVGAFFYSSGAFWINGSKTTGVSSLSYDTWYSIGVDLDNDLIQMFDAAGSALGTAVSIPAGTDWLPTGSVDAATDFGDIEDDSTNVTAPAGYEPWQFEPLAYEVAGTITDEASGNPIEGATARAQRYDTGELLGEAQSAADGTYAINVGSFARATLVTEHQDYGDFWQAETAYSVGDRVVPTVSNGHWYEAEATGKSAATEPSWPTDGSTVLDGGVTWRDKGETRPPQILGPYLPTEAA